LCFNEKYKAETTNNRNLKKNNLQIKNKNLALKQQENPLLNSIVSLIDNARRRVAVAVNSELTELYWHIGKEINENVLQHEKADYGKTIVKELSVELTQIYGRGFSVPNLYNFMKINELFSDEQIFYSLSRKLTWTHTLSRHLANIQHLTKYRILFVIDDEDTRDFLPVVFLLREFAKTRIFSNKPVLN